MAYINRKLEVARQSPGKLSVSGSNVKKYNAILKRSVEDRTESEKKFCEYYLHLKSYRNNKRRDEWIQKLRIKYGDRLGDKESNAPLGKEANNLPTNEEATSTCGGGSKATNLSSKIPAETAIIDVSSDTEKTNETREETVDNC